MEDTPKSTLSSLHEIKTEVTSICYSDKLDKDTALAVTELFHAMENLMVRECNTREQTISELRNSVELTQVREELYKYTTHDETTKGSDTGKRRTRWA